MLGRALKMAFWVTYDHLGKLLVASLVWAVLCGLPGTMALAALVAGDAAMAVWIGLPAALLCLGVAVPISTAGLGHMVKELIETRDGSLSTFFTGMRLYAARAAVLGLGYCAAIACLVVSAWFYAYRLQDSAPWLGYGLSALAVWALVFVLLTLPLALPALVQKKGGPLATARLAAMLVIDNPLLAFGLLVQVAAITALALAIPPVFVFLYGGMLATVTGSAYELLARKYTPPPAPDPAKKRHLAMMTGEKEDSDPDAQDDYLNRGFRDFLFPWKD
jgi:uncharacterized membrane protein YesL